MSTIFERAFAKLSLSSNINANVNSLVNGPSDQHVEEYHQKVNNFNSNSSSIRFLIFNEDSLGTRSVLFDSAVNKGNNSNLIQSPVHCSPISAGDNTHTSPTSKFNKHSAIPVAAKINYSMLKPMVYGSMPMVVSNQNAMKVHSMKYEVKKRSFACCVTAFGLRGSNKIMISNVFNHIQRVPQSCLEKTTESKTEESDEEVRINGKADHSTSNPVPILSQHSSLSTKTTCSSFASSANSTRSISPSVSMPAHCSYDCRVYKRIMRSLSSSLLSNNSNSFLNNLDESLNKSYEDHVDMSIGGGGENYHTSNKFKIGIAVIFSLPDSNQASNENFSEFFYSHLPIIECQIKELRSNIIELLPSLFLQLRSNSKLMNGNKTQLQNGNSPSSRISQEVNNFRTRFEALCNSPRLSRPAWLTVIYNKKSDCDNNKKQVLTTCHRLVSDFLYLCNNLNNPKSNDLVFNRILGALLKYNLSWITTILPNELSQQSCNVKLGKRTANWTQLLEKTNPYNPLWAQLGDLHGAIGHPLVLTRTVIVGSNKDLIKRLLFVLSYFIRCSASCYFDVKQEEFDFEHLRLNASNANSSALTTQLSTTDCDDSQREINIFDLYSSPVSNENNFKSPTKSSLFTIHDEILLMNDERQLNGKHHDDPLLSPDNDVFDPMAEFNKQMGNLIHNSNNTEIERSSVVMRHQNGELNDVPPHIKHKSKPIDLLDRRQRESDSRNIISSTNNSYDRSANSSQESKASTKQRHISSNSIGENCNAQELPLIELKIEQNHVRSTRIQDNFGYSLLAGYCEKFVFEFVLHGTSDKSFLDTIHQSLKFSKQNSILDCPIDEAIYIVADIDTNEVKVFSSETETPKIEHNINLVDSIVKSVFDLNQIYQQNEFLLLHFEHKLQELYFQSRALYTTQTQDIILTVKQIMKIMGIEENDYDLLNNIVKAIIVPNNIEMSKQLNSIF